MQAICLGGDYYRVNFSAIMVLHTELIYKSPYDPVTSRRITHRASMGAKRRKSHYDVLLLPILRGGNMGIRMGAFPDALL